MTNMLYVVLCLVCAMIPVGVISVNTNATQGETISESPTAEYTSMEILSSYSGELDNGIVEPSWKWHTFSVIGNWFSCCQLAFGTVGFGGNLVVLLVLFRRRHAKSSTDTLIGALAAADLLTSLTMIPRPYLIATPYLWLSRLYCYLVGTDAHLRTCITASVFTLTALSVQRYIAIIYPIRYRIAFKRSHTIQYVVALWGLSCVVNIYIVFYAKVDPVSYTCSFRALPPRIQIPGALAYMLFSFLMPVIIMVVTQVKIIHRLHAQSAQFGKESGRTDESNPAFRLRVARNRIISLVLIVIITFILFWTPTQFGLVITQIITVRGNQLLDENIYWSFVVVAYLNSCANPVIYTIRCPQFRKAVREMFTRRMTSHLRPIFDQFGDINSSNATSPPTVDTIL